MKKAQKDLLDQFAEAANKDPKQAIMLLLWQARHRLPELTAIVREGDIQGFRDSMAFMEAKPEVRIVRPLGFQGSPGAPAMKGRKAMPPRPAEPPRPFVVVGIFKKGTSDVIKPIENTEEGAQARDQAERTRRARDNVLKYTPAIRQSAAAGIFSLADINELCAAAEALARA